MTWRANLGHWSDGQATALVSRASTAAAAEPSARAYSVTELAGELGVTARALRFYEDKGLIAPSRSGANRVYSRRDHARMRLILRGKQLGFSLREIKLFLDLYDADPTHKEQLRNLLGAVRHRIAELEATRDVLAETLADLRRIEHQTLEDLKNAGDDA